MAGGARDAWLSGGASKRAAIQKGVRKAAADRIPLEASSDAAYRALTEDPRERARQARVTDWGGSGSSGSVSVVKAAGADDPPPPSRQLKDPFTTFYVQGIALEPPLPPERLLDLTEENAIHASCLGALATDACGRGWSFEPKKGKKGDTDLAQSEVPEQLRQQMEDLTPDLTFSELLYQAAWEMRAIGLGAWEVVRAFGRRAPGKHGDVGAVYPIPSHTLRATLDPRKWVQIRAGRVRWFKTFGAECTINNETGEVLEWSGPGLRRSSLDEASVASEIIIFKTYTPRSLWYGVPPWISAIPTIAELGAIREFNISWFASGGQVDYHMHFKAQSLDAAKEMKQQVDDQMRDNAGRGHTKLFTAGDSDTEVAVNKLGDVLREGHFRFRRGDLVKEVLIAHQVPPYRIGWAETGSLGGNAADEMLGAYRLGAVAPIQTVIEDRLRATLFHPRKGVDTGDYRLRLNVLDLEDLKNELAVATAGLDRGAVSPNQFRKEVGFDPDLKNPALDKYYYHGVELGQSPSVPGGGGGGWPPAEVGDGQVDQDGEPVRPDQAPDLEQKSRLVDSGARRGDSVRDEVRRHVLGAISAYESHLKAALADDPSG